MTILSSAPPLRLLFLCTHNSARSQIAEALARHLGGEQVEAFSAGTHPSRVHPDALATLARHGVSSEGLSSKGMDGFVGQRFDYVITVCDNARDRCPHFPGAAQRLHWSFPDPSAHDDAEARARAFDEVYHALASHIGDLLKIAR